MLSNKRAETIGTILQDENEKTEEEIKEDVKQ